MLRPTNRALAASAVLVCSLGLLAAAPQDGLRPVLPTAGTPDPPRVDGDDQAAAPAEAFDAAAWSAKLQAVDLDERERHLEALAGAALRDGEARAWVESTALGSDELAWTARMVRRELRRLEAAQVDPIWNRAPGGLRSMGGFGAGNPFDQLFAELDALGRSSRSWSVGPGVGARSKGFSMSQTPDGVRVEVTERAEDGSESVQTYEAESLDQLLEQHPELAEQIGGGPGGGVGGRLETLFGSDPLFGDAFGSAPGRSKSPSNADVEPMRTDILGVLVTAVEATNGTPPGLRVHDTVPGTIAHLLGIARGDLLLELNGVAMVEVQDISRAMGLRDEGGELRLRLLDSRGVERTRVWRPVGS